MEARRSHGSYVCCYRQQSVFVSGGDTWESFRAAIFSILNVMRLYRDWSAAGGVSYAVWTEFMIIRIYLLF